MRKYFRNLSPQTQYVIGETARVCACVALIVFAGTALEKAGTALFARD